MTPYYNQDGITIYHGDCQEILLSMAFDAVVTDPPYGVRAEYKPHGEHSGVRAAWDDEVPYDLLAQWPDKQVIWFGAASQLINAVENFAEPPSRILIWAPRFTLAMASAGGIAYRYHPIYTWRLPKQSPTVHDVLTDNTERGNWWAHLATKPLTLMTRLVGMTEGVICDPFLGSGTTLVAAQRLGREAIGIEIEERYCEVAVKRLAQGVLDFDK